MRHECYVLTGRGSVMGTIVHPQPDEVVRPGSIIVVPHAGVAYDLAARGALAVITEHGGRLCHLVIVSREFGGRVVRIERALQQFKPGDCVVVDCELGAVIPMEGKQ